MLIKRNRIKYRIILNSTLEPQIMFTLCSNLLKPSQAPSLLFITFRFLSKHLYRNRFPRNPNFPNPKKPTSASFDELVDVAGCSKDFKALHHILNKRYQEGCFNTSNTFRFVTEDQDPNTILDSLIKTLSNLDKGFTRKHAFDCLISQLSKSNYIDESLHVIDTMIRGAYGVNACTFHPLLNYLTHQKRFDEAWNILATMRDIGISVDVTAYNYLLTGYCFNGELTEAAGVIKKIQEEGLKGDSRTFDAMVLGACRVGRVEGALKLLRRMEEERVSVLYSTHAHVINGLMGLGCYAQAVEFVISFGGRDKVLDTENFGFLLSCLVRRKRVEEAKLVFGEMDNRELKLGEKLRKEFKRLIGSDGD